jgi:uncharacterized membrane protein YraQ (UPF0718 family)
LGSGEEIAQPVSGEFMNPTGSLLGPLFALAVIGIAIAILFGIYKPEEGIKKIGALMLLLVLIPLFIGIAESIWSRMPLWQRGLVVLIGILAAVTAVRGKSTS